MHMQEGIGRNGYRLLASVFLAIGLLGLVTTLYSFQAGPDVAKGGLFDWLGFGLSFVALSALFILSMVMLWKPAGQPAPHAELPLPTRPLDFEFQPSSPEPETGPEVAVPLAAAAPKAAPVVQPNRNIGRDAKGWPRRQPPSGLTMGERRELQVQAVQMLSAGRDEAEGIEFEVAPPHPRNGANPGAAKVVAKPTFTPAGKPKGREMAVRVEAPATVARVAGPDDDPAWNPEGTTTGRCGGCGAMLYAPKERPIHLRCPKCDKVTLLR